MHLTREQEELASSGSKSERTAMKLLTVLGDVHRALRLIPVTWAHVSGASYLTIGDTGIEFLEHFCRDVTIKVKTTVNPISLDLDRWKEMGIPQEYLDKQLRIVQAYKSIGAEETFSCIPYMSSDPPAFGDHMAWAESSAVIYANSILGARTNREGGPSALAAAVTGLTPDYGLHLDENRVAGVRVNVDATLKGFKYSLLGLVLGPMLEGRIPYFTKLPAMDDDLKWFGASLASTSDINLFHIEKKTPEWRTAKRGKLESVKVTEKDLKAVMKSLNTGEEPDAIGIGSPQLSADELKQIARLLKRHRPKIPVWIFTNREAKVQASKAVREIETLGASVWVDTCLEVSPLYFKFKTIATPSGKGAYYMPTLCRQKVVLDDIAKLLRRHS